MTLQELLTQSTARLETARVYSPREDAEKIAARVLGFPREQLAIQAIRILSGEEINAIDAIIQRRETREPLARIFGRTEFCGLTIHVGEGVFEPLPESESLIEHAAAFLKDKQAPRVLDLGTGSGCLLLGVLAQVPDAVGTGVDIAEKAVHLAQANAQEAGLSNRAQFKTNDWARGIEGQFDLIIANPPFIPSRLIRTLMPEVRQHDPFASLNGGGDGMRFYRRLAHDFERLAAPGALGLFQLSYTFAEGAKAIFRRAGYHPAVMRNHYGMPVGIKIEANGLENGLFPRLYRWGFGL